jgi:hypothetical protein
MATEPTVRAAIAADLPDVVRVWTRVERDGDGVAVVFENGAELRYGEGETGVEERWLAPDDDPEEPTRCHERGTDTGVEALALRTVAEYLSFDGRARAEFVWGEENLAALLGE